MKKSLVVLLVLAVAIAINVPAFAKNANNGGAAINPVIGTKVTINGFVNLTRDDIAAFTRAVPVAPAVVLADRKAGTITLTVNVDPDQAKKYADVGTAAVLANQAANTGNGVTIFQPSGPTIATPVSAKH